MAATEFPKDSAQTSLPIIPLNLWLRIGSAVVLMALVAAALWTGFVEVTAIVVAGSLLSAWEYQRLMNRAGASPPAWLLFPLTAWLALAFAIPGVPHDAITPIGAAVVVGLLVSVPTHVSLVRWATALGGACYLGFSLSYYVALYRWRAIDTSHFGLRLVALAILCVVVNDTAAYVIGSAFGRHRFFPSVSPKKSLEGAVAGAVASVALAAGAGPALIGINPLWGAGMGLLIAIAAQGGDLAESTVKRQAGVKDSSMLIPGHGGLLDRVDSLVLVGPALFCYLKIISL
jgi:phosphatidate cytidylyltransferase